MVDFGPNSPEIDNALIENGPNLADLSRSCPDFSGNLRGPRSGTPIEEHRVTDLTDPPPLLFLRGLREPPWNLAVLLSLGLQFRDPNIKVRISRTHKFVGPDGPAPGGRGGMNTPWRKPNTPFRSFPGGLCHK